MTQSSQARLLSELSKSKSWLLDTAFPFWATHGTDRVNGGFFERMSPDGAILHDARRTRLVARQIYVFSKALSLGWDGPATERVEHGLAFLLNRCRTDDKALTCSIDLESGKQDAGFNLYDYAFALFSLAAAASALPERAEELEAIALDLLNIIEQAHSAPDGGYQDEAEVLKSNPHMHMLEAAIAWAKQSGTEVWINLADSLADLCKDRFFDKKLGAVREYFDTQWNIASGQNPIEPGHQFEWAWLMMDWGSHRNRPDLVVIGRQLARTGEDHGISPIGLAINELSDSFNPLDSRHRLWPQTERIKAQSSLYLAADNPADQDQAMSGMANGLANLRRYFVHPVEGQWWEHLDEAGLPAHEPTRASSLYHIVCAICEVDKLYGRLSAPTASIL